MSKLQNILNKHLHLCSDLGFEWGFAILIYFYCNIYISKHLDLLLFFSLQHQRPSTYDRINHVVEGYDQKLHRDDREHAKSRGLKVNSEVSICLLICFRFCTCLFLEKPLRKQ